MSLRSNGHVRSLLRAKLHRGSALRMHTINSNTRRLHSDTEATSPPIHSQVESTPTDPQIASTSTSFQVSATPTEREVGSTPRDAQATMTPSYPQATMTPGDHRVAMTPSYSYRRATKVVPTCEDCGRTFSHKRYLVDHAEYCGRRAAFSCTQCRQAFDTKLDLVAHRLSRDACYSQEFETESHLLKPPIVNAGGPMGEKSPVDSFTLSDSSPQVSSTTRSPTNKFDPNSSAVFSSREDLLHNRLVHCTSREACSSILEAQKLMGSTPEDERYDGLNAVSSQPISRTHFEARPASDGVLFPFSRYPKDLKGGEDIEMLTIDVGFLQDDDYSLYYIGTTPTQFGQSFLTVYHTHIGIARRGSDEHTFAESHLRKLDKRENKVFSFSTSGKVSLAMKVFAKDKWFPHSVSVSFLGGLAYPEEARIEVQSGKKFSVSMLRVTCPVDGCSLTCASVSKLKLHYARVHADERSFECATCNKRFASKGVLECHERTHRTEVHRCGKCGKPFTQKGALIRHLAAVHRRQRLFGCRQCEKDLGYKHALEAHVLSVHRRGEKPFWCRQCDESFWLMSHLGLHMSNKHPGASRGADESVYVYDMADMKSLPVYARQNSPLFLSAGSSSEEYNAYRR